MTSSVAPLRIGSFRTLWIASLLSAVGSFIQSVAGSWLMFEMTQSNTWVGLMVASSTLPLLFFALAAGALADMFDRTKLMLTAQVIMGASALAMAIFTAADAMTPGLLLGLGLLLGVGVALNLPTWHALLPDLVPRMMIPSAVALQSAGFNVARAVGPAIGGGLIVAFGPAIGFAVNALSYAVVIAALLLVGKSVRPPERDTASFTTAISLGVRYARFTPVFRRLLLLVSLFATTSAVVQSVLPGHNETLGGDAGTLGLLLGAMGAGALVGAFVRERFVGRLGRRAPMATITLFGITGIGVGLAPSIAWAGVFMFLSGAFWVLTLTNLNATAQLMAPEWIRGRAMSLYSLAFGGILPLGAILGGIVADALGTGTAMVVLSIATVALGLAAPSFKIPSLDEVESPEFSAERQPPVHEPTTEGGPVVILNTWVIDEGDFAEFTELMNEIRMVRLRTGAYRWSLFRNASTPTRLTEMFATGSWEEHLAQHRRIDDASAALIARARAFDRADGPVTRHLIGIDVEDPPNFDRLLITHEQMHQTDGSIPLMVEQED
ncbi:MAG TPA: MFS transporter [Acidimicrobiia bacterium]|nr:MFS transporter [Acidimicrobiia bacterium]